MTDYLLEGARLVGGHPMNHDVKKDMKTGAVKRNADGTEKRQTFMYVAFPKNGATDWRQTALGKIMEAEAKSGFKPNETEADDFAWKIIDGDSAKPMRGGKPAPNTREGWPGNFVLRLSTGIPVRCYHYGKYGPMDQIQDKREIKCGDYCSVNISVSPNNKNGYQETNGLYLSPSLFRLDRPGEIIINDGGPSAEDVFGGSAASTPPPVPSNAPAPAAPPVPPPHNPLPKQYVYNGGKYSADQLKQAGWTDEQIATLPTV